MKILVFVVNKTSLVSGGVAKRGVLTSGFAGGGLQIRIKAAEIFFKGQNVQENTVIFLKYSS